MPPHGHLEVKAQRLWHLILDYINAFEHVPERNFTLTLHLRRLESLLFVLDQLILHDVNAIGLFASSLDLLCYVLLQIVASETSL